MRKANPQEDEMRPEYQRSDFGTLVQGKYADRVTPESNVVVSEPVPRTARTRVKKD